MDLNNLTIGQAKEIAALIGGHAKPSDLEKIDLFTCIIGKYVIVRSRNEGINSGTVEAADENGVILTGCRRIWHHKPMDKSQSWYEGVAVSGLSECSRISGAVRRKIIVEDYSITECSELAIKSIKGHRSHAQS